jgi:ComF family protein
MRLGSAVADLLFPPRCVACHRLGAWLCAGCMADIEIMRPPVCAHCGIALSPDTRGAGQVSAHNRQAATDPTMLCAQCRKAPFQLDGLRACAFHGGPLREAIHQFKYQGLRALVTPLGQVMSRTWSEVAPTGDFDAIVPVPLHPARQRERGYNQATLLARELSPSLGCPVVESDLVRVKATAPQIDLSAEQRWANMHHAFKCTKSGLAGKRVLLIDDVCTTGATLEAAAVALYQAGVVSVWSYTLARARL